VRSVLSNWVSIRILNFAATTAESILQAGDADVLSLGRELLRHADFVHDSATSLGAVIQLPNQYHRSILWRDLVIPGP
jgi:2,4-dienoyl-CoA reductase-like NADH-dependent reductase (Old Yellow Enzyme family)